MPPNPQQSAAIPDPNRCGRLVVAAAFATIALKAGAWLVTGSVGLSVDVTEPLVNLIAAVVALIMLKVVVRPADASHDFGRTKAEYFPVVVGGMIIFVAVVSIVVPATQRLLSPQSPESVGIEPIISVTVSILNDAVALMLVKTEKRRHFIILRADDKCLVTDVWASAGVLVGIALVWVSGWGWLDLTIAITAGVNILFIGCGLVKKTTEGLMDGSLSEEDNERLCVILASRTGTGVAFHQIRTRVSGTRQFMDFHPLVSDDWSVGQSHDLLEDLSDEIVAEFPRMSATGHIEPINDPCSYAHEGI